MSLPYCIAAIVLLIFCSAFFSASEMTYSSANRVRLENAMEDGSSAARMAVKISDNFDDALSAILIGNNLVNIAVGSLASVMMILLGLGSLTWVSTLAVTVLIIVFGETMPKIVAKKNANRYALAFAAPVRFLMIILWPVIKIVVGLVKLITLPMRGDEDDEDAAVDELQSIIETAEDEDVLDEERSELLQSALDFSEVSASEAMTARVDVVAIDIEDDWEDILKVIENTTYSRLPVYEGGIDNIIGFLYLNHYLKALVDEKKPDMRSLLMEPLYVYKTMKLPRVLSELRKAQKHLAVVTDEYGGTLGVITMEDVLEEIVGDIWDETDSVENEIVEKPDGTYELDGDVAVAEFTELMGWDEDSFDFESETVGGWTIEMLDSFPEPGQSFEYGGIRVKVLETDGRRVSKILVERMLPGGDTGKESG